MDSISYVEPYRIVNILSFFTYKISSISSTVQANVRLRWEDSVKLQKQLECRWPGKTQTRLCLLHTGGMGHIY